MYVCIGTFYKDDSSKVNMYVNGYCHTIGTFYFVLVVRKTKSVVLLY